MSKALPHVPIMVDEMLHYFGGSSLKVFFEGTVGAGGHAHALLEAHPEIERYIGCDKDPEAIEIAKKRLAPWASKVEFVHADFAELDSILEGLGIQCVDGFFLTSECHLCN